MNPNEQPVNSEVTQKSAQSRAVHPELNLSQTEYIICSVRRHSIGLIGPFIAGCVLIILGLLLMFNYGSLVTTFKLTGTLASTSIVILPIVLFCLLVVFGMYVAYFVYTNNKLYVTNERVIQQIQSGLFSKIQQSINLANINDVGFDQDGFMQQTFNYGSIRISTRGDERAYVFTFADNPKKYIAAVNGAIEAFKTGQSMDEILD